MQVTSYLETINSLNLWEANHSGLYCRRDSDWVSHQHEHPHDVGLTVLTPDGNVTHGCSSGHQKYGFSTSSQVAITEVSVWKFVNSK